MNKMVMIYDNSRFAESRMLMDTFCAVYDCHRIMTKHYDQNVHIRDLKANSVFYIGEDFNFVKSLWKGYRELYWFTKNFNSSDVMNEIVGNEKAMKNTIGALDAWVWHMRKK